MTDDLPPERSDDGAPETPQAKKPQYVHPLHRQPAPAAPDSDARTPARRVTLAFERPSRSLITWALIAINLAIFGLTQLGDGGIIRQYANNPRAVLESGEYWRLFTSMFLHADLIHVSMNMLVLYSLGSILEITFGHRRYILTYLLGGLAGSILSTTLNAPHVIAVGASGAVFALFGGEMAYLYSNWRVLGASARMRLRQVLLLAVLNFIVGFAGNATGGGFYNIDNWAHMGGFIGGALLAFLIGPKYDVRLSADQTQAYVTDARPFEGQISTVILFAAGLLGALLVSVLIAR
jgi:rhomboid protease GluP